MSQTNYDDIYMMLDSLESRTDSLMILMGLMIACQAIMLLYLGWNYANKKKWD